MGQTRKCQYCQSRKGKRSCPALKGLVCTACCGEHRLKSIDCPVECVHLGHMEYQRDRRDHTEITEAARAVSPSELGYDVLAASKEASHFAYELESKFVTQRQAYRLKDADIIEALGAAYLTVYRGRPHSSANRFSAYLVEWVRNTLGPALEEDLSAEEQEMIVLRLILSVKNMTGGANGEYAYLNYISDQFGG